MILPWFRCRRTYLDGVKYAEEFCNSGYTHWPDLFDFSDDYRKGVRDYIHYREDILDNL